MDTEGIPPTDDASLETAAEETSPPLPDDPAYPAPRTPTRRRAGSSVAPLPRWARRPRRARPTLLREQLWLPRTAWLRVSPTTDAHSTRPGTTVGAARPSARSGPVRRGSGAANLPAPPRCTPGALRSESERTEAGAFAGP